ncbi:MAG: V-type ATP synthase subunit A [Marine Group III euryarchaeote CG-Epi1]|uniref:A-type ATP synthase subunit A n=1 Tax=Marine Group III euryarchaeote CG-Epi1 TaxID=1888995 RepID=A0A1J5TI13_9ARCH|nr:MAG: V-type ATP synthase subunit A [Marine Group III euryarchaeote CG-Epi1]|tara:strand:- start:2340 stop:4079 length:1740 start_codon:yes stop_codon:yes gene_type:complete
MEIKGEIYRVSGPVVTARGVSPRMYDVVLVGHEKLMGEVIGLEDDDVTIQVYEDTSGVKPGEPVENTGEPLSVELGPGLLTSIYDGIQRPLPVLQEKMGDYIERGVTAPGLDHSKKWDFVPTVDVGASVDGGQMIGTVQETPTISHKILVPPFSSGKVTELKKGTYTVDDVIGKLDDGTELKLMQLWPVRVPRPYNKKFRPDIPLVTGTRTLDGLFPIAKGGTAAIPGGFGTGKTVTQQTLAKWSDAQIVVYVGCGERGNEMTEVLTEFPHLKDPKTGGPLMDRTVLIANTSNMPVAAREASVYTGITLAEYYRDQGYDVAMMADSTSRWAEAMREISSRLEEMPGEEGYPAYLAARLSEFYERAGRVQTKNDESGSVTVIGAVSPPGGDFSEPVTQNTLRIVKVFWALDSKLAQKRHFPAINWLTSYSLYNRSLEGWYTENAGDEWNDSIATAMSVLTEESKLQEIVQLVGSDALPEDQQLTLEVARMLREFYLQQNAFHDVDTYCTTQNQSKFLSVILHYKDLAEKAMSGGIELEKVIGLPILEDIGRAKFEENMVELLDKYDKSMANDFAKLMEEA